MKTFLIILFILILLFVSLFVFLSISGKKNLQEYKQNKTYLTIENYLLIRDSPFADELSKYAIHRENNSLRFTRKGEAYTLFYLKLETGETNSVKLIGLDGYGIRDREFLKYTRNLVDKINEKN